MVEIYEAISIEEAEAIDRAERREKARLSALRPKVKKIWSEWMTINKETYTEDNARKIIRKEEKISRADNEIAQFKIRRYNFADNIFIQKRIKIG